MQNAWKYFIFMRRVAKLFLIKKIIKRAVSQTFFFKNKNLFLVKLLYVSNSGSLEYLYNYLSGSRGTS